MLDPILCVLLLQQFLNLIQTLAEIFRFSAANGFAALTYDFFLSQLIHDSLQLFRKSDQLAFAYLIREADSYGTRW